MENKQISLYKLLALSIELEGCITVTNDRDKRFYPVVEIGSRSHFLPVYFRSLTGLGRVYPKGRGWRWRIKRKKEVREFLEKTVSYYWLKEPQAKIALELLQDSKNKNLYNEIKNLNSTYPRFDFERYYQDKELPTEVIHRLVQDPVYFIEKLFPIELFDYQKALLRSYRDWNLNLVEKGRQLGISFSGSCFALWWCATHPYTMFLILALYKKQAKQPLEYCKQILWKNPVVREELIDLPYGSTRTKLRFQNRAEINASNCSKPFADNVRSMVAHVLWVDEAILLLDRQLPAIEPITAFTLGKEIWVSTVGAEGCGFHRKIAIAKNRITKEELICPDRSSLAKIIETAEERLFYLPACEFQPEEKDLEKKYTQILCPQQTPKRLQRALETLKTIGFRREYLCEWLGKENSMFPIIQKWGPNYEDYSVPDFYWPGLDVGDVGNPTVLTVLKGDVDRCKLVKTKQWKRAPTKKRLAKWIKQSLSPYKPLGTMHLDKQGVGAGLYERVEEIGIPVLGIAWNRTSKNRYMFDLKDALTPGVLRVHEEMDQVLFELRGYYGEQVEGTNIYEFHAIDTDDYVDSLALAWGAVPKWSYPKLPGMRARDRRVLG